MQYKSTIGADFLTKEVNIDEKWSNFNYGIQQVQKNFIQWENLFIEVLNVVY